MALGTTNCIWGVMDSDVWQRFLTKFCRMQKREREWYGERAKSIVTHQSLPCCCLFWLLLPKKVSQISCLFTILMKILIIIIFSPKYLSFREIMNWAKMGRVNPWCLLFVYNFHESCPNNAKPKSRQVGGVPKVIWFYSQTFLKRAFSVSIF